MKEVLNEYTVLAVLPGLILGIAYFGGLWLTVSYAVSSRFAALYLVVSYVSRIAIALAGFYYVGRGSWQSTLICLAGFIMARYLVLYLTSQKEKNIEAPAKLENHEA